MASTGKVVTLAVHAVDFAKLRLVAPTVVTAAFPAPTAHLFSFSFTAGSKVQVAYFIFWTLTIGAMVAWVTVACATSIGACIAAVVTVGLREVRAVAITLIIHRDLQTIFKSHGFDSKTLLGAWGRTAMGRHTYVEGNLKAKWKFYLPLNRYKTICYFKHVRFD